jgi:hypothetical protein
MQTMLFGWLTVPMDATASGARPRSRRGSRISSANRATDQAENRARLA